MCGIAGMISLTPGRGVSGEPIRRMTDSMAHRGPDGSGLWISPNGRVGLGHRRLAIVDLSDAGRQPMSNDDATVVVTFNGEIYNFRELRRELESDGFRFRSESDTEVLVYLYERHGASMVEKLDGDFAFAIWDERARSLFLARDRFGVKPLYFASLGGDFYFASEIRALLEGSLVRPAIDEESLYHYLTYLAVPAPGTLLQGIRKLRAAETMTISLAGGPASFTTSTYWRPLPGQYAIDSANLDDQLSDLFHRSVKKRLMSDVPVGVLFSGGVDSTLNAVHFDALIRPEKVRTFFVGMPGNDYFDSEIAWSRRMAEKLGTEHHEVLISEQDMLETASAIAKFQDEPLADPVCVPLYFVSRLARSTGTIVLHAGEGADEIFCGYDNYRKYLRYHQRYWRPFSLLPSLIGTMGHSLLRWSNTPRNRKLADAFRRQARRQPFFLGGAIAYYEDEKRSILSPDFRRRTAGLDSTDVVMPLYKEIEQAAPEATFLQKITFIELQLRLPELLLMRVDKMSMAHSIEVRVPFLDRELVDFSLSVPEGFKLRDGVSKEPLKRLAAASVGRDAVYRKKSGFGVPIHSWFHRELGSEMRSMLLSAGEWQSFFDVRAVQKRLDRGPSSVNEAFQLWVIYNLMVWHEHVGSVSVAA
ncbi:MAG TPA: asparagine synthase (glutamine-hydrolyzing) [Thermoanaerobaculia bacterium]|nr:asparagine synthase (glutamine-hydrolyzing) [Thermoanaerobaculia bacterium]